MRVVPAPAGRLDAADCPGAKQILTDMLYLPVQPGLSNSDIQRLADALAEWNEPKNGS